MLAESRTGGYLRLSARYHPGVLVSQQTVAAPPIHRASEVRHRRGFALAIIVTCQLMLVLDATVMNVALPRIQADLHFSATSLAWVMSSYTLTYGGLLLLGGRAGDILGRRRMFVAGVALFTLASLAGGLATSSTLLLVARVLQGAGAAAAGPSTIALIATTFTEPRERLRALAVLSGVASGGFAIGLIVGGTLTELASWRWVLFINVPFGLAAVLLAPRFVHEVPVSPAQRNPTRLDLPGAVTATAGVASLVYAFIEAATHGWSGQRTVVALVAGIALVAAFLAIEVRAGQPLMPLRLFADRNRAAGYGIFFLAPAAMMSMFFFLTQFLQEVRGFSALATGFAFLPMAVGLFGMTRLIPYLLPRLGPKPLVVSGSLLVIGGLAWLTQLTAGSGYAAGVLGPMVLMGVGAGMSFVPLTPVIMAAVAPHDAGAASGALQTMQQTGASLGLAVLVTVFGAAIRHGAPDASAHETLVSGMTAAFATATLFAAGIVAVALTFRSTRTRQPA
jgi:EmrB/QacA subfamily drug resistance transporter